VGGAIPVRDLAALLERTGFVSVEHVAWTGVATSRFTCGATFRARKA
jgi:hypothetical protein